MLAVHNRTFNCNMREELSLLILVCWVLKSGTSRCPHMYRDGTCCPIRIRIVPYHQPVQGTPSKRTLSRSYPSQVRSHQSLYSTVVPLVQKFQNDVFSLSQRIYKPCFKALIYVIMGLYRYDCMDFGAVDNLHEVKTDLYISFGDDWHRNRIWTG